MYLSRFPRMLRSALRSSGIRYSVLCTEDRGNVILRKLVIPYQSTPCLSPTVQIQKPSLPTPSILRFKILFQFCWYSYLRDKNSCLCSEDGGFDFRSGSSKSLGRCRGNYVNISTLRYGYLFE